MAESVVVGVRVRPFNKREQDLKATVCVDMQAGTTFIESASGGRIPFSFDQSFWSHDEFEEDSSGYMNPVPGGRYADQRYVYETFGKRVLDNAWAGYHCCLFAYGQTGAGKSYSMVGYGSNKGIVPISCEEIFKRVNGNEDPNKSYEIQISMVEIYNEAVQDLFIAVDDRPKKGLDIRESNALGIYVHGVIKHAVGSYEDIERTIDQGTSHRSLGSTQMNATSSRAHTVITIEFKQVEKVGATQSVKVSNINLIDLAGSEKAGQTGATGDRLKEGSAINKSLSALGNVIEKLAEKSSSSRKDIRVPYRDSKLTRLLQNALGGSSKTIMICALSPASSNYEETLSTLRYADRAKKIKNAAVVNENPQEKLMREIKEENQKLKQILETGGGGPGGGVSSEALEEAQDTVRKLNEALAESNTAFHTKLEESKKREAEIWSTRQTLRVTTNIRVANPILMNLNAEMQLAGRLKFEFPEGKPCVLGSGLRKESSDSSSGGSKSRSSRQSSSSDEEDEEPPTYLLSSPGVRAKHAKVQNINHRCYLSCMDMDSKRATWVNGVSYLDLVKQQSEEKARLAEAGEQDDDEDDAPEESVLLEHCDRLVLGKTIFLFIDPRLGIPEIIIMSGMYTYARARKELPLNWKDLASEGGVRSFFKSVTQELDADGSPSPFAEESMRRMSKMSADRGHRNTERKISAYGERKTRVNFEAAEALSPLTEVEEAAGAAGAQANRLSVANRMSVSSYRSIGDESDESESDSMGEGATHDEVFIARLKKDITVKDREVADLQHERDHFMAQLQVKDEELARLTSVQQERDHLMAQLQVKDEELTRLTAEIERLRGDPASRAVQDGDRVVSTTRRTFNEQVAGLNSTLKEALAALDNTQNGLMKAVASFDDKVGPRTK